jgi:hypothetical protein
MKYILFVIILIILVGWVTSMAFNIILASVWAYIAWSVFATGAFIMGAGMLWSIVILVVEGLKTLRRSQIPIPKRDGLE